MLTLIQKGDDLAAAAERTELTRDCLKVPMLREHWQQTVDAARAWRARPSGSCVFTWKVLLSWSRALNGESILTLMRREKGVEVVQTPRDLFEPRPEEFLGPRPYLTLIECDPLPSPRIQFRPRSRMAETT